MVFIFEENFSHSRDEFKIEKYGILHQPRLKGGNRPQFHQKSLVPAPSSSSALVPKFRNDNKDRVPGPKPQSSISNAQTNPFLCAGLANMFVLDVASQATN